MSFSTDPAVTRTGPTAYQHGASPATPLPDSCSTAQQDWRAVQCGALAPPTPAPAAPAPPSPPPGPLPLSATPPAGPRGWREPGRQNCVGGQGGGEGQGCKAGTLDSPQGLKGGIGAMPEEKKSNKIPRCKTVPKYKKRCKKLKTHISECREVPGQVGTPPQGGRCLPGGPKSAC